MNPRYQFPEEEDDPSCLKIIIVPSERLNGVPGALVVKRNCGVIEPALPVRIDP